MRKRGEMRITLEIKVFCTCGTELRIVWETAGEITVAPCKNPECRGKKQSESPT
jgi:hypothetical protein